MTPTDLIVWVGSITLCVVMIAIAVAVVVGVARNLRNPPARKTPIYRSGDHS